MLTFSHPYIQKYEGHFQFQAHDRNRHFNAQTRGVGAVDVSIRLPYPIAF